MILSINMFKFLLSDYKKQQLGGIGLENVNTEESILLLKSLYYEFYPDMQKMPINITISDSLSDSYIKIRPDSKERFTIDEKEKTDDNNGLMVLPYVVGDNINILLNKSKIIEYTNDGSMTWLGTFAHELTHAIDFYQMALKEKFDYYDSLLETDKYFMFHLWSEYHARKIGYCFLCKQLNIDADVSNEKDRIEYIQNIEWPNHINRHYSEYHKTDNGNKQMNDTMQLQGRYSVWCDLFPEEFNESVFKETFKNTPWMYSIFTFLRQHSSLDAIYPNFEAMRLILKENWGWL